jgi:sporulation protein YlmC with PRC-barrel domain
MTDARAPSTFIESDRIEGIPVYSGEGQQIGKIKRLIIDKANGRVAYIVITLQSPGLGDVPYLIPWARLSYEKNEGTYRTDITEAQLRSAPAGTQVDWGDREALESLEAFFRIPHGWRAV